MRLQQHTVVVRQSWIDKERKLLINHYITKSLLECPLFHHLWRHSRHPWSRHPWSRHLLRRHPWSRHLLRRRSRRPLRICACIVWSATRPSLRRLSLITVAQNSHYLFRVWKSPKERLCSFPKRLSLCLEVLIFFSKSLWIFQSASDSFCSSIACCVFMLKNSAILKETSALEVSRATKAFLNPEAFSMSSDICWNLIRDSRTIMTTSKRNKVDMTCEINFD